MTMTVRPSSFDRAWATSREAVRLVLDAYNVEAYSCDGMGHD
jgi:hypothetical protein